MVNIFDGLEKLGFSKIPKIDSIFQQKPGKQDGESDKHDKDHEEIEKQDIMEYISMKKRLCVVCGKTFNDVMLRARKCRYLRSDMDLRPYYTPFQPMYYDVVVCHFCGYAAMNSHFDQITDKQIDMIIEKIKSQYKYKEYPLELSPTDAVERYLLALLCATTKVTRSSEKAMLCLRLAWLARDQKEEEREKKFLSLALEGFELAYSKEDFPIYGMESDTLYYLIGELNRRNGFKDKAMRCIGQVIVSKTATDRLKDRAREVRELLKSEN